MKGEEGEQEGDPEIVGESVGIVGSTSCGEVQRRAGEAVKRRGGASKPTHVTLWLVAVLLLPSPRGFSFHLGCRLKPARVSLLERVKLKGRNLRRSMAES